MATTWHTTCPCCGTPESTEVVAAQHLFFEDSDVELPSHRYSVCVSCYKVQVLARYGPDNKQRTLAKLTYKELYGDRGEDKPADFSFLENL